MVKDSITRRPTATEAQRVSGFTKRPSILYTVGMRVCETCGLPTIIGRAMHWSGDGNIFADDVARTQLVFIKTDEVNNIMRGISGRIGLDIGGIVSRAEAPLGRRLSKAYYAEYLSLIPGIRMAKPTFLMKGFYERIFKVFSILGFGTLSIVDYHPRKSIVMRARKPHNRDLVAGLCRGFFEQTEGVCFEIAYDQDDGELVRYSAVKGKDCEETERFHYDEKDGIPGNVQHRTCGTCGVPVRISQTFYWDAGEGLVGNQRHHMREVLFPVDGINSLFRELSQELGEDIDQTIVDLQREYKRDTFIQPDILARKNYLGLLRQQMVKGLGNFTEVDREGDVLRVTVENPFNVPLLAGRVAGYYEAMEDRPSIASWEADNPRILRITVEPA